MSRTFPRAMGAIPEKCVSRMVRMEGLTATNYIPPNDFAMLAHGEAKSNCVAVEIRWKKILEKTKNANLKIRHYRIRYAAEAARVCFGLAFSSPSQRTLTIFETPGSCMVTPYSTLPISMVLRLWVTTMN